MLRAKAAGALKEAARFGRFWETWNPVSGVGSRNPLLGGSTPS